MILLFCIRFQIPVYSHVAKRAEGRSNACLHGKLRCSTLLIMANSCCSSQQQLQLSEIKRFSTGINIARATLAQAARAAAVSSIEEHLNAKTMSFQKRIGTAHTDSTGALAEQQC
jgi:hypothetical protein